METFFSKNADILLKERHLTQQEFCKKLGKSKSNWGNIVKTNNLEMLSQIAQILEMKVEDIIGLKKQDFSVSGFIKVSNTLYEIRGKQDIEVVIKTIAELEKED